MRTNCGLRRHWLAEAGLNEANQTGPRSVLSAGVMFALALGAVAVIYLAGGADRLSSRAMKMRARAAAAAAEAPRQYLTTCVVFQRKLGSTSRRVVV